MTDADYLRSEAQVCLDVARLLSDQAAAEKLQSEATALFARAAELDAREKHSFDAGERSSGRPAG